MVRVAVLVRHHAHDFLALHFGAERAADAAVGAGGDALCSGWPFAISDLFRSASPVGQACTQAPHETHSESMNGSFWLAATFGFESAALDRQRERALLLIAGAHAARADDALARDRSVKYGIAASSFCRALESGSRRRSRSALRAGRRRRPCPAARSGRWRGR